jgi:hypothetical protein
MSRYLVTRDFSCLHRVDRETRCYYMADEGTYEGRWKKQYGDQMFDTFAEAKEALTRELYVRLRRAERVEESDLGERSTVFVTHPLRGETDD